METLKSGEAKQIKTILNRLRVHDFRSVQRERDVVVLGRISCLFERVVEQYSDGVHMLSRYD